MKYEKTIIDTIEIIDLENKATYYIWTRIFHYASPLDDETHFLW